MLHWNHEFSDESDCILQCMTITCSSATGSRPSFFECKRCSSRRSANTWPTWSASAAASENTFSTKKLWTIDCTCWVGRSVIALRVSSRMRDPHKSIIGPPTLASYWRIESIIVGIIRVWTGPSVESSCYIFIKNNELDDLCTCEWVCRINVYI